MRTLRRRHLAIWAVLGPLILALLMLSLWNHRPTLTQHALPRTATQTRSAGSEARP
jgi:hypothetical protein